MRRVDSHSPTRLHMLPHYVSSPLSENPRHHRRPLCLVACSRLSLSGVLGFVGSAAGPGSNSMRIVLSRWPSRTSNGARASGPIHPSSIAA
ncbi:hypothetical protein SISSUDRAFT_1039671 [Sistotremastrum suecicum HHB10207 ss-3]|uniref:Uncharacterized protein n=1 Tax=Sistotremastrum suecicum HHB10207 ss-3 TaxID=1314776 RepID=A0A166IIG3_9AGAM|nr:hypothetical protein SISSUDRAFT_1039671 [Sistotremastrum suecicum HHB10207 ss-3]